MSIPYPQGTALTCQEIRELDALAIENVGIPGVVLMENAGRRTAEFIYSSLIDPSADRVAILCGSGNNGGDGFVVARHLRNAGVHVDVILAGAREKSVGDAGVNLRILERMKFGLIEANTDDGLIAADAAIGAADIVVDALLGTGSTGSPRGLSARLIELANASDSGRRIAIDIPSGLDGDSGVVHKPCFVAAATVTMIAPKVGFEVASARAVVGRVVCVDIGTPRELILKHDLQTPALDR